MFEGQTLPKDYEPDGITSIRGLTVVTRDRNRGSLSITDSIFLNNPWDGVLSLGEIDVDISDTIVQRNAQNYFPNRVNPERFCDRVGDAIAALRNSRLKLRNCTIRGYNKALAVWESSGADIDTVKIESPVDWDKDYPYKGFTILSVFFSSVLSALNPFRPRGNLSIKNLSVFTGEELTLEEAKKIPVYNYWFQNLDLLGDVDMSGLNLPIHLFEARSGYPNSPKRNFRGGNPNRLTIKDWITTIITHKRNPNSEYDEYEPELPEGWNVSVEEPKIVNIEVDK